MGVEFVGEVQHEVDQTGVVRCGAHPGFGRDTSPRVRCPVVPHALQVRSVPVGPGGRACVHGDGR
ncbi:hypothetical protein ACFPRL_06760 [Pseudoclavibacter helvolus]